MHQKYTLQEVFSKPAVVFWYSHGTKNVPTDSQAKDEVPEYFTHHTKDYFGVLVEIDARVDLIAFLPRNVKQKRS